MNRFSQAPSMLWFLSLVGAAVAVITCNAPSPYSPMYQPMTSALHTAEEFPITHGEEENPTGDCNVCHGGFESFSDFSCLGCHKHEQAAMNATHASVPGYAYESKSCLSCHPDGEGMSRDAHSYFPIASGDTHEDAGCLECHTDETYSGFSCLGCHEHEQTAMSSAHSSVAGYTYDSNACLSCHPDGTAVDRDSHTYFPITTGTNHEAAACAECHTGDTYEEFSCLGCHEHEQTAMNSAHSSVSDYAYESSACLSCHPDGEAMDRDSHTDFPIASGSTHEAAECAQCHTTSSYEEFSCLGCHEHAKSTMDSTHAYVSNYVYESSACLSCHPNGTAMSASEHAAYFPISSGNHSKYGCNECHLDPSSYEIFTCTGCHDGVHTCSKMDKVHQGEVSGYRCDDHYCYNCHPDGRAHDD